MTLNIEQESTTGIWLFDAAGTFSQINFQEEYSNIVQNYASASIIKILVDLRLATLPMDYDTLIKVLIAFMDRNTPEEQRVNMAFVIKDERSIFKIQQIKIDKNLRVTAYLNQELAMAWLRS